MKYIFTVIAVFFILFATSCSGTSKDKGEIKKNYKLQNKNNYI